MKESTCGTLVINMDYMMNHEETQDRESSREYYGKRVIVLHGTLSKHKYNNNILFKRVFYMSPEGCVTQDVKSTLANLDTMRKCVKQENIWNDVKSMPMLCDDAGTYSAVVFHVVAFDVVKSHRIDAQ